MYSCTLVNSCLAFLPERGRPRNTALSFTVKVSCKQNAKYINTEIYIQNTSNQIERSTNTIQSRRREPSTTWNPRSASDCCGGVAWLLLQGQVSFSIIQHFSQGWADCYHEYKSWHTSNDILIFSSFCRADYENGYSRNLLWRLWHLAHLLGTQHLFQMCTEVRLIIFRQPCHT